MNKKTVKRVFLVMLGIWLIITVFFYFQHRIQVDTYEVGKYIEFEDFSIFVKNIEKYNYENKHRDCPDTLLSLNLPWKITETILKVNYFYSRPYHFNNDSEKFNVNCCVILNKYTNNVERSMLIDKLDIKINNHVRASNKTIQTQSSSDSNTLHYRNIGEWQDTKNMDIRIINKETNEVYSILIDKSFSTNTYGFFNRKIDDANQMASDTVKYFNRHHFRGEVEDSELYINKEYIQNFPWNILNQYKEFNEYYYELEYLGKYMNDEEVFIMTVCDYKDNNFNNYLEFYMIFEDMRWQIIDVRSSQHKEKVDNG